MSTSRALLLVLALVATTRADARPVALLAGTIVPGSLRPLVVALNLQRAGDTLPLYIDSPGGEVSESLALMAALDHARARGVRLPCYVLGEAESAAFWILLHCSARYALPQSRLLFHHIRIEQATDVTAADAARMQTELQGLDDLYLGDIYWRCPGVPRAQVRAWMDEGVEWTAAALQVAAPGVLTGILPVYPGLLHLLSPVTQETHP